MCGLVGACSIPLQSTGVPLEGPQTHTVAEGRFGVAIRQLQVLIWVAGCQNYGPFLDPSCNTEPRI